jgi:release factor glutamine methyltransferase
MTIKEAVAYGAGYLEGYVDSPSKEARLLLMHLSGLDSVALILQEDQCVDEEKFLALLQQRKESIPIEYITNQVSFYSREFYIDEGALIPRPETEILIDKVLEIAREGDRILDVGCGSGIIPITLRLEADAEVSGIDISAEALRVSQENAQRFGVEIPFWQSDLLSSVEQPFDIIVSNPPYIADDYKVPEGLGYEPQNALFGGLQGDELLKRLIDESIVHGARYLCFEMGYDQKESLEHYLESKGIKQYTFYKDLAGFDRGCVVKLKDDDEN